jgi:DNA modification methylase
VPINSKATYLSNSREIAISCIKGGKAIFNSEYDNGIYKYPIYQGKREVDRIHPTQKSLELFEELIQKHTNENDVVVDPFGGSATTYIACMRQNRKCYSSEISGEYYAKCQNRIQWHADNKASQKAEFLDMAT